MIGGIIRVSSKGQEATDSPENQRQTLTAAGATTFYEDTVSGSAKGGDRRRQSRSWQQLTADITSGKLTKLLVCDVSRIARRDHLIMELVELCDANGVELLANSGGTLSAKSATQWLSLKQQGIFAEYFARELSDKVKRGQAACIARGVFGFTSAHVPWHLQKDPDDRRKVIPRPAEWKTARQVISDYIEGRITMSELCRVVHAKHGVMERTAAASKWLRSGWLRGHYQQRGGAVLIANVCEPLITEAEHELLQQRLAANRKTKGTRAPHRVHALSGLCFCSGCGGQLTYSLTKTYSYLRCGRATCPQCNFRIRADELEYQLRCEMGLRCDDAAAAERRLRVVAKPSKELLNHRRHVQSLEAALKVVESPGVRADYQQAVKRLEQLEAACAPAELPELSVWQQVRQGSEGWWAERDENERQVLYRSVLERAVVNTETKELLSCEWL